MTKTTTRQEKVWDGEFGQEYNVRNNFDVASLDETYLKQFGVSRSELNKRFLDELPRDIRILEVGCNFGGQLLFLQDMGFTNLWGVELQWDAIELSKERGVNRVNIVQGSGYDIPFKDNFFDLVYTSDVLIHISPNNIGRIIKEMHRVSNQYLWGFEYYNDEYIEVKYRDNEDLLWKGNSPKIFQDNVSGLSVVKQEFVPHEGKDLVDIMYLLKK